MSFEFLLYELHVLKMHDFQSMVNMNQVVVIVGLSKYPNCLHATFDMLCTSIWMLDDRRVIQDLNGCGIHD